MGLGQNEIIALDGYTADFSQLNEDSLLQITGSTNGTSPRAAWSSGYHGSTEFPWV